MKDPENTGPRENLSPFPCKAAALAALVALSMTAPLSAQNTADMTFERFSTADGLSNYVVNALLQDHRGFLWIGTQIGINRYDGYDFTSYTPHNSALKEGFILSLYEDHLNMLWIGTRDGGVYAFNPDTERFTGYTHDASDPGSLSHNEASVVYEDRNGTVWVGTRGGGLNRFDRATGRFRSYRRDPADPHSIASDSVWAIHDSPTAPGVLWVGTDRGLDRLDLNTETFQHYEYAPQGTNGSTREAVLAIHEDRDGVFWIGTRTRGLYTFRPDAGALEHYVHAIEDSGSLSNNHILSLYEDRSDVLWVGTRGGGLNRFDRAAGRFTRYVNDPGDPRSLPHNNVFAICMDRSGVLWAGTWGGLVKHVPRNMRNMIFRHYAYRSGDPNGPNHPMILRFREDRAGNLWVGTWGGGLNRLDPETNRFTSVPLAFDEVWAIHEDRSGALWLGTRDHRLYHFDPGTAAVTSYPLDEEALAPPEDIVLTIYEAPSEPDILWIGTQHAGLYKFDTKTREVLRRYVHDPADSSSLSDNFVWPIYEDRQGSLWIGTYGGGLDRFDRGRETFTRYRHVEDDPYSIGNDRVTSIEEGEAGTLWVGTVGGGLNKFEQTTGRFRQYTVQDGLGHIDVMGVLTDAAGNLWISTVKGLSRFDPRTETFTNYGVADGLQGTIFHIGAAFKNARGDLFFGGDNGFNVLSPSSVQENSPAPPIALTGFRLFGEPVKLDTTISAAKEITLDYDENFITFEFAALDFTDPPNNQYRYRLEGVDDDWVYARNQRNARYPDLKPRTYTFRVTGSNSNNVWNEAGAAVRIVISPPWWQTGEFRLFAIVLILGLAYTGYRLRVRSLEARSRMLEMQVAERTAELEATNQQLKAHERQLETQNTHLEEQNAKIEEQARRLMELSEIKSRFFANISHEFRTPLTLILGPLQGALDGAYGSVSERLRQQLGIMRRSGSRLLRLINQLLDLSRLEAGSMTLRARRADLLPFLRGLVFAFASTAEHKHITLLFHAEDEATPLYFEPDKLEKIVSNLLSNAFKFTPEHGKVWVSVTRGDGCVEIVFKDTGRGIPADELPHIFDRFHQVDASSTREHEGTGIGLALTKELTELHGGSIRVESEPGFGTTFFVRLPEGKDHLHEDDLLDEAADPPPLAGPRPAVPWAESVSDEPLTNGEPDVRLHPDAPTILLVEDNADVLAFLKSHLAMLYRIEEAADGVEGLEKTRETRPDLVISDVMMPRMDGYALCKAIKTDAELNHIPVILLTAKASEDSKLEGLGVGADDYIYKPFSPEELLARTENLIELRRILRRRFSGEMILRPTEIPVTPADAAFLEQVREVIEAHMGNSNFGVEWLADEVGLGSRQLRRRLRQAADLTPAGFIKKMRLERAAYLLEQQAGTVSETAYAVGFQDPNYFSRLFRQTFGVPPSEYATNQT